MLRPQLSVSPGIQTGIDAVSQDRSLADAVVARSGTNFKAWHW